MQRFLQQVASYFFYKADQTPTCLVFPNKRSAIFFRRYYTELSIKDPNHLVLMPETTTIGQFLEQQSGYESINGLDALFEMYEAYRAVSIDRNTDTMKFDRFVFWGRMMISDFNDIDASLANAKDLYKNLKDLKEIKANFLTDEQLEALRHVFGSEWIEEYRAEDNGRFWQHIDDRESEAHERFVKLWQLMYDIYVQYTRRITAAGLAYPGLMARSLCNSMREHKYESSYSKIAFVGFNAPSLALTRIMQLLQLRDNALFFWDKLPDNSLINSRVGRRVARLAETFPMPADYTEPEYLLPEINVCPMPSKTMQTKEASAILRQLKKDKELNTTRQDNTAVILPDPSLLTPLVQSLPNDIGELNITMGLPMRNTFFASLMRSIVSLQANAEYRNGYAMFRSKDVRAIVSNPRLLTAAYQACSAVIDYLDVNHTYMVSAEDLVNLPGAADISVIFKIVDQTEIEASHKFLNDILKIFKGTDTNSSQTKFDTVIIESWQQAVDNIFALLKNYEIEKFDRFSYFGLVWRTLSTDDMHLSGSPLKGLQIMGMLETRALDFENIIVLSLNNNVCPPRNAHRTFIPAMLRRAFGLPVNDDYVLEYDYYLLRMLSRSKRVTYIYDARASTRRNARSHIIDQLVFMRPKELVMKITPIRQEVDVPEERVFAIEKTDEVMERVNKLKVLDSRVSLSASALKVYRKCPLRFYLSTICGLREENDPEEFMTAAEYGTIVHRVLEDIFNNMRPEGSTAPVEVTEGKLTGVLSAPGYIKQLVDNVIDELYHHNYYKNHPDADMPGESLLLSDLMVGYIRKVIEKEIETVKADGSFKFVEAEEEYYCYNKNGKITGKQYVVNDNLKVNFTLKIDRHDIMHDGSHRLIDYKTGKDTNRFASIAELFDEYHSGTTKTNDAALQVLIYAEAYKANHPNFNGKIIPSIYKLQKAYTKEFSEDQIKMGSNRNYNELTWSEDAPWREEFVDNLNNMIESIFDRDIPFRQTQHIENCKDCSLHDFCMRKPKKEY